MFSSVGANHKLYTRDLPKWKRCRVCVEGEDAVKACKEDYLPKLTNQSNAEYEAYLARASFVPATGRVLKALIGLVTRKPPTVSVPENAQSLVHEFASTGEDFEGFSRYVVSEVATTGRYGLLVDASEGDASRAYVSGYCAENIVNWRTEVAEGETILKMLVLEEEDSDYSEDFLVGKTTKVRKVLYLDDNGVYSVVKFRQQEKVPGANQGWSQDGDIVIPTIRGKQFYRIPFILITPTSSGTDMMMEAGIVLDLANVNLSHYRTSADLEHGRHFTALPTAWVAGFDPATTELYLGSSRAWVSSDVNAKAGFLEFSGSGLGALEKGLAEKWQQMAALGSRVLEADKAGVEAAETLTIRKSSENSVLSSLVQSSEAALYESLSLLALWSGVSPEAVSVEFNREFYEGVVDPALLGALGYAVTSGTLSFPAYFDKMQKSGLYKDGWTMENELAAMAMGIPGLTSVLTGMEVEDPGMEAGAGEGEPGTEEEEA
jgi:hypothetical protein